MRELREFTKIDHYGWQGATNFADGSEPLIAEGEKGIMIVCGSEMAIIDGDESAVISVYFGEYGDKWGFKSIEDKDSALKDAKVLISLLDEEFDAEQWRRFGFEVVS